MIYLTITTLVWAFSFSLIGVYLSGQVDPYFAVLTRILLATLVFAPLLRPRHLTLRLAGQLMAIGAIQLGVMYVFYYHAFLLLTVPEVLIFTIFTPVYITLFHDLLAGRFNPGYLVSALLAVLGAAIIRYDGLSEQYLVGFLVVQGANLCFAVGQVAYKWLLARQPRPVPQHSVFACFFLGALLVALPAWWWLGGSRYPSTPLHWGILLWLGLVASGLGYYWWNKGATLVNPGALAVMNNALIPAGLVVNLLLWGKAADVPRLLLGALLMSLALWLNERWHARRRQTVPGCA
ncbi:carboxylate/amino acid/amine transporter [Pseudaeromonas sp. ZJS20]|uniref:carboxylate/amino acid/amine transporter n=1 Tax=Pseudaeromonas aegiceratis TaxID=3153928 RepID=UPI00390C9D85